LAVPEKTDLVVPGLQDQMAGAWQLAFVLTHNRQAANDAALQAFVDVAGDPPADGRFRIPLLAAVVRITGSTTHRDDKQDDGARRPEVAANFWHLPATQRAVLWLTQEGMDVPQLAPVLALPEDEAGTLVDEAVEWLEATIDQVTGPLCRLEPLVPGYLDGDLPPEQAMEMDEHVPTCPTCQTRIDAREGLAELGPIVDNAVPPPPGGLALRALDRLEEQRAESEAVEESRRSSDWRSLRPLAACCAGLMFLGLLGLGVVRPVASAARTTRLNPSVSTTVAPSPPIVPATAPSTSTTLSPAVTFPTGH
jgi:hypothetical protein